LLQLESLKLHGLPAKLLAKQPIGSANSSSDFSEVCSLLAAVAAATTVLLQVRQPESAF
jgi:hypothetical protein